MEKSETEKRIDDLEASQKADQEKFDALAEKAAALLAQKEASQKTETRPETPERSTAEEKIPDDQESEEKKQGTINETIIAFTKLIEENSKLEETLNSLLEQRKIILKEIETENNQAVDEENNKIENEVEAGEEAEMQAREEAESKNIEKTEDTPKEAEKETTKEKKDEYLHTYSENDLEWSYPKHHLGAVGKLKFELNNNETTIHLTQNKFGKKERNWLGKKINSSQFKTIPLKEPYWEVGVRGNEELEEKFPDSKHKSKEEAMKKINEIAQEIEKDKINLITEEIKKDKENKPFKYFIAEKIENPFLKEKIKNRETGLIDLRDFGNQYENELKYTYLQITNEGEGFFKFNLFGFVMIIKNVEELRSEEGIESNSPKAVYKIIGPKGEIISDDIKGYEEASKIYTEETLKYEKEIREKFMDR